MLLILKWGWCLLCGAPRQSVLQQCLERSIHGRGEKPSGSFLGLKDLALSPVLSFGVSSWENYVNMHPCVIKFAGNIFDAISKE